MKENRWNIIHTETNYKKDNFITLNKKKNKDKDKDIKYKSNNIIKKYLFKNKKLLNNSKLYKSKIFPNNIFLFNILKLILIILFYSPILALKEIILRKLNYISEITLIIKGSGDQRILDNKNGFNSFPSEILVNGINQTKFDSKVYGLTNTINNIILRWNYQFKDCSFMFFKGIIYLTL